MTLSSERSENKTDGRSLGQVERPDPTGPEMVTKKQKPKSKKATPTQSRSAVLSVLIGTVLNMAATAATCGAALICLVVVKHFI
jgi:hypothetical protein